MKSFFMIVSKEIRRGDGWPTIDRSAIQRDEYHFRVVLFTLLENSRISFQQRVLASHF